MKIIIERSRFYEKKYGKIKNNKIGLKIFPFLIVLSTLFISIGFSALQDSFSISDSVAMVRVQADIRITGVHSVNPVSGALSNYDDYRVKSIASHLVLPNSDSKMTYKVEVTNFGNVPMAYHRGLI